MKVLIIEDEQPAQDRLIQQLKLIDPSIEMAAKLDSIKSSVQWLENNPHPDLLFLDIQLADGLSFSIFDSVVTDKPIIFCTAYDEYAIQAFKHNSIDYLLKPIDQNELKAAVDKFKSLRGENTSIDLKALQEMLQAPKRAYKQRFMVKLGDKIKSIKQEEIQYLYSEHKATFLKSADDRKFIIDYTLDQLEELLNPSLFFRLNRKYIAQLDAIEEVYAYSNSRLKVKLKSCDDNDILVSREKVGKLKEWLDA